jgi:hypothetical protein
MMRPSIRAGKRCRLGGRRHEIQSAGKSADLRFELKLRQVGRHFRPW